MVEDVIKAIRQESKNIEWVFIMQDRKVVANAIILDNFLYTYEFTVPEYELNEWDYRIAFHVIDNILKQFTDDYFKVIHR